MWENLHFCMFLSISASLGLRSTTAVHISENSNILDFPTALLELFFIPLLSFQEAKLVNFCLSLYSVATYPCSDNNSPVTNWVYLVLCCAVLHTFDIGNVLSEGPGTVLGKWRICLWGSHSHRQNGLGYVSKFCLFSWDSTSVEETASIWLLLRATEMVYSSLRAKRLLMEVF